MMDPEPFEVGRTGCPPGGSRRPCSYAGIHRVRACAYARVTSLTVPVLGLPFGADSSARANPPVCNGRLPSAGGMLFSLVFRAATGPPAAAQCLLEFRGCVPLSTERCNMLQFLMGLVLVSDPRDLSSSSPLFVSGNLKLEQLVCVRMCASAPHAQQPDECSCCIASWYV